MARAVLENAGELRPLRCTGALVTEVEPGDSTGGSFELGELGSPGACMRTCSKNGATS